MSWISLFFAGLFEVGWAVGLKYTDGFSKPLPTALTAAHFRKAGMPAQTKVSKALLPHHSAPRLGSVCP